MHNRTHVNAGTEESDRRTSWQDFLGLKPADTMEVQTQINWTCFDSKEKGYGFWTEVLTAAQIRDTDISKYIESRRMFWQTEEKLGF